MIDKEKALLAREFFNHTNANELFAVLDLYAARTGVCPTDIADIFMRIAEDVTNPFSYRGDVFDPTWAQAQKRLFG